MLLSSLKIMESEFMNEKNKYEDIEKMWEESNWTYQARQIIVGINEFPKNSKIILIIRHSHRKVSRNIKELSKLGLTYYKQ